MRTLSVNLSISYINGVGKETKRNTVALRAELRATLQYIALIPMHYIVHVLSNFLDVFTIPQA